MYHLLCLAPETAVHFELKSKEVADWMARELTRFGWKVLTFYESKE